MQYDQSWMGYGIVGGLQAGSISALAAVLLFVFFHWLGRRNGWSYGPQIGWTFLSAAALTASGDLWNLFYFNYAQLQSLQLLKAKLALYRGQKEAAQMHVRQAREEAPATPGLAVLVREAFAGAADDAQFAALLQAQP